MRVRHCTKTEIGLPSTDLNDNLYGKPNSLPLNAKGVAISHLEAITARQGCPASLRQCIILFEAYGLEMLSPQC